MAWVQVDLRKVACKICFELELLFRGAQGLQLLDLDPQPLTPNPKY